MVSVASATPRPSAPVQDLAWSPIVARFGADLLTLGFNAIPHLVFDSYTRLGISHSEMMFVLHVWQHWWGTANPHPSLATIAVKMGVTWRQAHNYAKSLEAKGFLIIQHRSHPDYGQLSNEYDFSPLLAAVRDLAAAVQENQAALPQLAESPVSSDSPPLQDSAEAPLYEISDEEDSVQEDLLQDQVQDPFDSKQSSQNQETSDELQDSQQEPDPYEGSMLPVYDELRGLQEQLQEREAPPLPLPAPTRSVETSQPVSRARPLQLPTYLRWLVDQHSDQLHDQKHLAQNQSQVSRLYQESGLSEQEFGRALHQAYRLTKQRRGLDRPMAFYFVVLKDVLGLS